MSVQNGTTPDRRVQGRAVLVVREPRHGDLAAAAGRLERRLITIAAVVAVVWVVVHLAEVLVAVGLLAAARRVLHL